MSEMIMTIDEDGCGCVGDYETYTIDETRPNQQHLTFLTKYVSQWTVSNVFRACSTGIRFWRAQERPIIVMLRMYASLIWAAFFVIWNITKWVPTILITLWVGGGFVLPVACRVVSCLWTCMFCTYSVINNISGAVGYVSTTFVIPVACRVVSCLWTCMPCTYSAVIPIYGPGGWKVEVVVGIVMLALIDLMNHFDKFDKRMERSVALHTALIRENRRFAHEAGQAADNAERTVPTQGAYYDYSMAYELSGADETNSEE
jgi:hypothetical protein